MGRFGRVSVDPGGAEDLPDGRRGEFVTEPCELAVDSPVSPVGMVVGEADGRTPEFRVDRWACRLGSGRLGPVPCNELAVPSQHCLRSDNQDVVARRVRSVLLRRARIVRSVSLTLGRSIWRCNTRIW